MYSATLTGLLSAALLVAAEVSLPPGFEHFYNLEYDAAIEEFSRQIARTPEDPAPYNHLAMSILYRELFRTGALETELVTGRNPFLRRPKMNPSPEDQRRFDEAIRKSMSLSEARLKSNPNDTRAMYLLGVAYGLRANYNFLVRKAWLDALRDATSGRKLHNRVTELDPANVDARLMQGVHDYVVGSLPWHWKVLGFLAGFRGDRQTGIRTLEYVAEHGHWNRYDAQVLLAAVYRRERLPQKAVPLLVKLIERFPRNYLFRFELAQMYSDLGDKKNALAAIQQIEELKAAGVPGYRTLPSEKIYYARGTVQFWYNELDQALENMKRVTARARDLDLNTGTFAWLRLGQIYDLRGERSRAVEAYRQAIALAPQSEAAQESRRFLTSPYQRPARGTARSAATTRRSPSPVAQSAWAGSRWSEPSG
ncbi:MAG: tetratricopeptide repeat protein [Bryobacteraceae bacterium]|nr:tetratricopeptide repeat protein [Bryobacteraceae bacterium]